jgi:hypothetical protein
VLETERLILLWKEIFSPCAEAVGPVGEPVLNRSSSSSHQSDSGPTREMSRMTVLTSMDCARSLSSRLLCEVIYKDRIKCMKLIFQLHLYHAASPTDPSYSTFAGDLRILTRN